MNKSEQFNRFSKWVAFGGQILEENDRDEQRKLIKYNHLMANCLIFHNVCGLTQRLHEMRKEGVTVDAETLSRLSPYAGPRGCIRIWPDFERVRHLNKLRCQGSTRNNLLWMPTVFALS